MNMGIPQVIMIVLVIVTLMLSARDHGTPKTGYNNVWVIIAGVTVQQLLLWWGGFWG